MPKADPLSNQHTGPIPGHGPACGEDACLTCYLVAERDRLRAENEALKHVQQWRAVGVDSTDEGVDADFMPWRAVLAHAQSEASAMRQENDPPYDEVVIQTRWLSEPKRYVNREEQHRLPGEQGRCNS